MSRGSEPFFSDLQLAPRECKSRIVAYFGPFLAFEDLQKRGRALSGQQPPPLGDMLPNFFHHFWAVLSHFLDLFGFDGHHGPTIDSRNPSCYAENGQKNAIFTQFSDNISPRIFYRISWNRVSGHFGGGGSPSCCQKFRQHFLSEISATISNKPEKVERLLTPRKKWCLCHLRASGGLQPPPTNFMNGPFRIFTRR